MSVKIHDALKQWLIETATELTDSRGNRYYTRVFSGDSQPLDVRSGKYSFKYQPDVVLDRKGRLFIIEIAQWEDWRAWVGEMAIVKALHPSSEIYFVFFDSDYDQVNSVLHVIDHILNLDWWGFFNLDGDEMTDFKLVQKRIGNHLKEIGWFF